jgi:NAD(P)-dependent dehydrogenase (short-subunit alcohol dehydrogenase family)
MTSHSYNAAKGATVHLNKLMSAEFMKAGIRVNSVAPGYFPSEMTVKSSDDRQKSDLPAEKVAEKGHVPQMRGGRDEEMSRAMLMLATNTYVNGQILVVDGGVLNTISS